MTATAFEELFHFPDQDFLTDKEIYEAMRNENIPKGSLDFLLSFKKKIKFKPITYNQTKNPFYKISKADTRWIRNLCKDFLEFYEDLKNKGYYTQPFYQLMLQEAPLKNSEYKKQPWTEFFKGMVDKHKKGYSKTDFSEKQINALLKFIGEVQTFYTGLNDLVMEQ